MKALSVKQPWASMIAEGKKTIETRTWPTKYRGDILICASKKSEAHGFPTGCAICVAQLVDCRLMVEDDYLAACCPPRADMYSWVLENIRQVKPFPVKGQLRIFEVEMPDAFNGRGNDA